MKHLTPEYEYKQVNTRDIFVDPLYQRDLNSGKVNKIVREFNPYLVNAIKLSYREGKFWVFDGQHTIASIKAKHNGRDCMVDCKIFYGLTRLDEMDLFIAQNGASSAVKTHEKFRALYNNGDPDITGMVKASEKAGMIVDFKKNLCKNRILAVKSLFEVYKLLDKQEFQDVLTIIREAWGGRPESLVSEILTGMTRFYITYHGEFNRKRLIKCLSKQSPIAVVRDGKVAATSGPNKYARVILAIYNQNAHTNRLEDRL